MITMKGAAVSAKLKEQVEKGLETLTWVPKLTIIRVGENPDDISYEKGATKKLTSFGLEVESKVFPGDISDEAFKKEFAAINADASVDGILMLRPLPKQINEQDIEKSIRRRIWTVFPQSISQRCSAAIRAVLRRVRRRQWYAC